MAKVEDQSRFRRVFRYYRYIEADAFAQYLHEMSLKGWHLKEWKLWLEFEKGESRDIEYAVEVFLKGSEMDVKPGADVEEYAEYCRAAGWEFVDSRRRFCIFRKIAEDAIPIVTEEERFKNIRKAEWKRCLMSVLTGVFILGMSAVQLSGVDAVLILFSNMLLLPGLTLAVLFACEILQCIVLAVWCIKAGKKVRAGEHPSYGKSREKYVWYAMAAIILIELTVVWGKAGGGGSAVTLWIFLGITAAVLLGIGFYRPARRENWALQLAAGVGIGVIWVIGMGIIFIQGIGQETGLVKVETDGKIILPDEEKLPLVLTDYTQTEEAVTLAHYSELSSVFGTMMSGAVEYGDPSSEEDSGDGTDADQGWQRLAYTVYRTDVPWILDLVWKEELESGDPEGYGWITETDADSGYDRWHAEKVMRRDWEENMVYVRYEDAVLTLYATEPPRGEQIDIVREKLGL